MLDVEVLASATGVPLVGTLTSTIKLAVVAIGETSSVVDGNMQAAWLGYGIGASGVIALERTLAWAAWAVPDDSTAAPVGTVFDAQPVSKPRVAKAAETTATAEGRRSELVLTTEVTFASCALPTRA